MIGKSHMHAMDIEPITPPYILLLHKEGVPFELCSLVEVLSTQ